MTLIKKRGEGVASPERGRHVHIRCLNTFLFIFSFSNLYFIPTKFGNELHGTSQL